MLPNCGALISKPTRESAAAFTSSAGESPSADTSSCADHQSFKGITMLRFKGFRKGDKKLGSEVLEKYRCCIIGSCGVHKCHCKMVFVKVATQAVGVIGLR
jgi:hypothetical protein